MPKSRSIDDESQEVVAEEESTETEAVDLNSAIEEDVNALLSGEDFSEEFKEKAKTILKASINAKITDIENQLNEEYEKTHEEVQEPSRLNLLRELMHTSNMSPMNG